MKPTSELSLCCIEVATGLADNWFRTSMDNSTHAFCLINNSFFCFFLNYSYAHRCWQRALKYFNVPILPFAVNFILPSLKLFFHRISRLRFLNTITTKINAIPLLLYITSAPLECISFKISRLLEMCSRFKMDATAILYNSSTNFAINGWSLQSATNWLKMSIY